MKNKFSQVNSTLFTEKIREQTASPLPQHKIFPGKCLFRDFLSCENFCNGGGVALPFCEFFPTFFRQK